MNPNNDDTQVEAQKIHDTINVANSVERDLLAAEGKVDPAELAAESQRFDNFINDNFTTTSEHKTPKT